jgi:hypothetical protein
MPGSLTLNKLIDKQLSAEERLKIQKEESIFRAGKIATFNLN